MYTHKYLRPHHSWFILLSDNNNNIIQRIMLLADRLSSCKFHSCTRYLDMYTAISRKVVGKTVHAIIPKGNMGYDRYTFPDIVAVEPTFIAFL